MLTERESEARPARGYPDNKNLGVVDNADFLSAALVGNQQKLQEIDARMADLRQRLGGSPHHWRRLALSALVGGGGNTWSQWTPRAQRGKRVRDGRGFLARWRSKHVGSKLFVAASSTGRKAGAEARIACQEGAEARPERNNDEIC